MILIKIIIIIVVVKIILLTAGTTSVASLGVSAAATFSSTLSVAGTSTHVGPALFTSGISATSTSTGAVVVSGGVLAPSFIFYMLVTQIHTICLFSLASFLSKLQIV